MRFKVKGILRIARRMIGRRVQRIEAMIFVFDFGTVRHGETNFPKTANDILGDLSQRMQLADEAAAAGQA